MAHTTTIKVTIPNALLRRVLLVMTNQVYSDSDLEELDTLDFEWQEGTNDSEKNILQQALKMVLETQI